MRKASKVLIAAHFASAPGDPHLQPLFDAGFELVWNTAGRFLTEDELVELLPAVPGTQAAGRNPGSRLASQPEVLGSAP